MDRFIALAEGLGIRRLATRDVRHVAAVRLRDGTWLRFTFRPLKQIRRGEPLSLT